MWLFTKRWASVGKQDSVICWRSLYSQASCSKGEIEISGIETATWGGKKKTANKCCGFQFRDTASQCSLGMPASQLAPREGAGEMKNPRVTLLLSSILCQCSHWLNPRRRQRTEGSIDKVNTGQPLWPQSTGEKNNESVWQGEQNIANAEVFGGRRHLGWGLKAE